MFDIDGSGSFWSSGNIFTLCFQGMLHFGDLTKTNYTNFPYNQFLGYQTKKWLFSGCVLVKISQLIV